MTANQTEPVAPLHTSTVCTEPPNATACSPSIPCRTTPWAGALAFSLPLCRGEARHPVDSDRTRRARDQRD